MAPYPHHPKSTKSLLPGEYWPLVFSSGRFGCGRVVELTPPDGVSPLRSFLAAIIDWIGEAPPTDEDISNRKCLDQMVVHVKAVTHSGQNILGCRSLESDGIEPWVMREAQTIRKGFTVIRDFDLQTDRDLPEFSYAGYDFLDERAEFLLEEQANQPVETTDTAARSPRLT